MGKTSKRAWVIGLAVGATVAGTVGAQYMIMDMVANRVIQKYQNASCEQLWENRGKAPSEEEQRAIQFLRSDPNMRQQFFNQIAGPVMNKMFECGMIP
jgi:hypothetical protein